MKILNLEKKYKFDLLLQLTFVSHNCVSSTEPMQTPPFDAPVQLRNPIKEKYDQL